MNELQLRLPPQITINPLFFPPFVGPPRVDKGGPNRQPRLARLGEDVRLQCPMSGTPMPLFAWFRVNTEEEGQGMERINAYEWDR